MWSLSPHLRADHMGNSMKIRMRFIQNMQWRQQKGCEKNDALYDYDSFWSQPWCQKGLIGQNVCPDRTPVSIH